MSHSFFTIILSPLVSCEEVSCINLFLHIFEVFFFAVGEDDVAFILELLEVFRDGDAHEGVSLIRRFVDEKGNVLVLQTLDDALNGGGAEVVAAALHDEAVDAGFLRISGGNAVSDEGFPCLVGIDDGADHGFRDAFEVREELSGVFRQAVSAVAEGRIVVEIADSGVVAHAFDDVGGLQALFFGIGVDFIEVGDADGEEGVGEEFDGLCFRRSCDEDRNVLADGAFLFQGCEFFCFGAEGFFAFRDPDDDAGRVEVVVESFAFAEEFRREENGKVRIDGGNFLGVSDRDGGFDDDDGLGADALDLGEDGFDGRCVEVVRLCVIVRRSGDDDQVCVPVRAVAIHGGGEVEILVRQVVFDVIVDNRGFLPVDHIHFFLDDVHGSDLMVLGEEDGIGEADVACACNCDFHGEPSF